MGAVFNIGCECSKKMDKQPSVKKIKVTDYTSSVLVSSTIVPKELYTDKKTPQKQIIRKKIIDDINVYEKYIQICILGKSYYSIVFKVKNRLSSQMRAMKEISKENIENANDTKNIVFSINVLRNLTHPNLIQLHEFYEDEKNFYLIYDLCEKVDLDEILKEKIIFCEFLVKFIMYKVLLAVVYLHKQKIIHGDIKITNIGIIKKQDNSNNNPNTNNNINNTKNIKELINEICDSIKLKNELLIKDKYENLSNKAKTFINNLVKYDIKLIDCWSQDVFIRNLIDNNNDDIMLNITYFSPELFNQVITKERDEWACGILMFYLINGYYPFEGEIKEELVYEIMNKDIDEEINELHIGKECKDLLFKLLNKNPNYRIRAEDALKHEFFQKGIKIQDLINLN